MSDGRQDELKEWITAEEAGRILGVSSRRVRQLIGEGKLVARKKGNLWLVSKESVYEYLAEQ